MCQTPQVTTIESISVSSSKMLPDLTHSVAEIATFLANEIFKTDPDMETMREYAQQLVLAGFRTKALLVANVKVEDVSGWRWMRMFHMDLFEQWINDNKV
jgi:hypothetical protein